MKYSNQYKDITADFGVDFKKKAFDKDGIESAIKAALGDLQARTLKKKAGIKNYPNSINDKYEKIKWFAGALETYFDDSAKTKYEFDIWHDEMCKSITTQLGCYYDNWAYGKSQKIVNMTFKYLYCLAGAENKSKYFQHCHMPLDRFILEWMKREVKNNGKKLVTEKVDSWSSLGNQTCAKKYSYSELIGFIRGYFDNPPDKYDGLTMFQAEFYIWKEIQLHMALEGIYNQLVEDKKARKEFKTAALKEKCDEALGKLDALKSILDQN